LMKPRDPFGGDGRCVIGDVVCYEYKSQTGL
jgi:hypothetical protein